MACSDLFLEACCHMLVTVVCGFVRDEDRQTASVCVQMGRTPLTPTDVLQQWYHLIRKGWLSALSCAQVGNTFAHF